MEPRLATIFGDGMVLQRGVPVPVWGSAPGGATVTVEVAGRRATAVADQGSWRVLLPPLAPGGPVPLVLNGVEAVPRVWVGDVWLCAGQSNMERSLEACASWPDDALGFRGDPGIRQLCLPNQFDFSTPRDDLPGARWIGADTGEVGRISAVGFSFAREIRARTGVPQGLILVAVGGSSAQAWLSLPALASFPRHRDEALRFADPGWRRALEDAENRRRKLWWDRLGTLDPRDPTRAGRGPWRPMTLPSWWAATEIGDRRGSVWYRKTFFLDRRPGTDAKLRLGTLVDSDDVWVNGVAVGATAYQYPSRRYRVPASCLVAGENTLLVRLVAPRGGGGVTHGKPLSLETDRTIVDLAGTWAWRPGAFVDELPADTFLPMVSAGLHYGELVPLVPYGVKSVLWYQGESNAGDPSDYEGLMRALMDEWRSLWGQPKLPFFLVQLPLLEPPTEGVQDHGWPEIRDIQRRLADEASTLVVTLDLGEWNDLHPSTKEGVGLRLARAVLARLGDPGGEPFTGPLVGEATAEGPRVRLRFSQALDGLATSDGEPVAGVYLAGEGAPVRAEAVIDGSTLVVSAPGVDRPRTVYYAWAANPAGANLVNRSGLPASPFRVTVGQPGSK